MGVNKMLKAGLENEEKSLEDQLNQKKITNTPGSKGEKGERVNFDSKRNEQVADVVRSLSSNKSSSKSSSGRPTNKSKGKENRKQYTLTLKESNYKRYMTFADAEGLSFAKFMEKAAEEYISKING